MMNAYTNQVGDLHSGPGGNKPKALNGALFLLYMYAYCTIMPTTRSASVQYL